MKNKQRIHGTYLCTFCGKNQGEVSRLIAGPGGVYVCNECVHRFSTNDALHTWQVAQTVAGTSGANRCSFCGKPQKKVQRLVLGPDGVNICDECLTLCQKIMAEVSRLH